MKWMPMFLFALSAACFAQHNELSVSAIGNFNPVSYIWIQHPQPEVFSSNRSSIGGAASYQRWAFDHLAFGVSYEQNPSSGKLFDHSYYVKWPQMRYEIAAVSSQQIAAHKLALFIREGAGSIITNGYRESGWSHDFAVLAGFGVDCRLSPRVALRTGLTVLASKTGCYNDHTCRPTWATVDDAATGLVFRF